MIILRQKEYSLRENSEELIEITPEYQLVKDDRKGIVANLLRKIPSIKNYQDSWVHYNLYRTGQKKSLGSIFIEETNKGSDLKSSWFDVDKLLPKQVITEIVRSITDFGKKHGYNNVAVEVFDGIPGVALYR